MTESLDIRRKLFQSRLATGTTSVLLVAGDQSGGSEKHLDCITFMSYANALGSFDRILG